jgi:hypothetical protein
MVGKAEEQGDWKESRRETQTNESCSSEEIVITYEGSLGGEEEGGVERA